MDVTLAEVSPRMRNIQSFVLSTKRIGPALALVLVLCPIPALASDGTGNSASRRYLMLGLQIYESGNLQEARQCMEKAFAADSKNARAVYYLGRIHNDLEDYPTASEWFERWKDLGISQKAKIEEEVGAPYKIEINLPAHLRDAHGDSAVGKYFVGMRVDQDGKAGRTEALAGKGLLEADAIGETERFRIPEKNRPQAGTWVAVEVNFVASGGKSLSTAQEADSKPSLLKRVDPEWPPDVAEQGISGCVEYRAKIGPEGKVLEVEITGGPEILRKAAEDAVSQQEYRPAKKGGKAVTAWIDGFYQITNRETDQAPEK